jgi:hypothetical protein
MAGKVCRENCVLAMLLYTASGLASGGGLICPYCAMKMSTRLGVQVEC